MTKHLKIYCLIAILFAFASCGDDNVEFDTTLPRALEDALLKSDLPYEIDGAGGAYHPSQLIVKFKTGLSQSERNNILLNELEAASVQECMCGDELVLATWDNNAVNNEGGLEGIKQKGEPNVDIEELTFNYYSFAQQNIITAPILTPIVGVIQNSSDLVVAIVDAGVDYSTNSGLNGFQLGNETQNDGADNNNNCLIDDLVGWDFVNDDNDAMDDHGHGTHITNIFFDNLSELDPTGQLLETVRFIPVKTHNSQGVGNLFDVSCGIIFAAKSGADVINCSWGFYSKDEPEILRISIEIANALSNAIIVTSMGNESEDLSAKNHYPSQYNNSFNYVYTVGASNAAENNFASFSNYYSGSDLNILAPGDSIEARMPSWYPTTTEKKSGTSMSVPALSAAVIASIKECGTNDPNQILTEITNAFTSSNTTINGNSVDYINYNSGIYKACP